MGLTRALESTGTPERVEALPNAMISGWILPTYEKRHWRIEPGSGLAGRAPHRSPSPAEGVYVVQSTSGKLGQRDHRLRSDLY